MNMATFVSFIQWEGAVFSLLEIGERLFVAGGATLFCLSPFSHSYIRISLRRIRGDSVVCGKRVLT